MLSFLENIASSLRRGFDQLTRRAARVPRRTLAWASIALAVVLLLSVNLFSANAFRSVRGDLTQNRVFTISSGTRAMLKSIDEPISVRLYYSKRLGEAAPTFGRYYERVRSLLEQYRNIAGGKLDLAIYDPEPFSDAEDRAVAAGLRGVRLNQEGDLGYFGLVGRNATDNDASIAFFATDREAFLEYDLTKLIYTLANPKKRVVGLMTGLQLDGGMSPMAMMGGGQPTPPAMIMEQIREFFEVKTIAQDVKEIPAGVDVLMIAQPDKLTADAAYAIDQYALSGGKVLAFVDPVAESAARMGPMGMGGPGAPSPEFVKLLKAWGVNFDAGKAVGDIAHARRVQFGGGARPTVTEYVAWLALDAASLDQKDVLSGGIERLNLASAGFLTKVDGATTQVTPIFQTSPQAMQIGVEKLGMAPDPVGLLRAYKPEGKALMLAARISGEAKTAFADGPPKEPAKDAKADTPHGDAKEKEATETKAADAKANEAKAADAKTAEAKTADSKPADAKAADAKTTEAKTADAKKADAKKADAKKAEAKTAEAKTAEPKKDVKPQVIGGRVNAIVVADTDFLTDHFWVDVRDFMGQQVAIPNANNAAFVVNALDNLSGSEALIGLRGRGADDRPFTLVNDLRRDAERRYREKEQALTNKLKEAQDQLSKLENTGDGGAIILSETDRQTIDRLRADMLNVRRDLREVKRALREDIDQLDGWLKFTNIALVPLLIGFGGLGWTAYQRRRGAPPPPKSDTQGGA